MPGTPDGANGWGALSKRERTIAVEFAEGLTYQQIGEKLFIAPATVRAHLAAIYRKLDVHNKASLVRLVLAQGASAEAADDGLHQVTLDGAEPEARATAPPRPPQRWGLLAAAGVFGAVLLGGTWHLRPAAPAPATPSIAVLPFDNLAGDDTTGRLAEGITEDVITDLARFRDLDVIARNSTAVYRGKSTDVRTIGTDLNVRYVLEGSIQRQGDRLRITAQLIDADDGAHVWVDRWERAAPDFFAIQSEIAEKVAGTLGGALSFGQITRHEAERAKRQRPTDLTAYDLYLLGVAAESEFSRDSIVRGIAYESQAIERQPDFARAHVIRAWLSFFSMMLGADPEAARKNAIGDAERAVQLDPLDAEALATLGNMRGLEKRWTEAEGLLREAVELGPANAHVLVIAAANMAIMGSAASASALADRAIRLDPHMTAANATGVKDAYYLTRRYADTVALVGRYPLENRSRDSQLFFAASLNRLGRVGEATAARAELLRLYPSISAERMLNEDYAFRRPEEEAYFVDTFRLLDLPVCLAADEAAASRVLKRLPECVRLAG